MISVRIRHNGSGEERTLAMDIPWHEYSEFWWSEGNAACDCNRADWFAEAGAEPEPDQKDTPCGSSRFSVTVSDTGGAVLYDEIGRQT